MTVIKQEDEVLCNSGGDKSWAKVARRWKILIALLSVICVLLLIILLSVSLHKGASNFIEIVQGCGSPFPLQKEWLEDPPVFQDLNEKELEAVRDYLYGINSLNLTKYDDAKLSDNFILLVELYLPSKELILKHLDEGAPKPVRYARTVIFHGAKQDAYVEEYLVHPAGKPTSHDKPRRSGMKYPIPYYARSDTGVEYELVTSFIIEALRPVRDLIAESFDGYSLEKCGEKCLVPSRVGFPASKDVGMRQDWFALAMDVHGFDLGNMPLSVLISHADKNLDKWTIDQVYYHNQYFGSVDELQKRYKAGTLQKCNLTLSAERLLRMSMRKRGKSYLDKPQRGPELVEPNGRRFSVIGRKVKYMPWEFEFGFRVSKGLTLYNVRFDNRRVLYELGVQEAVSFYSSNDALVGVANYIDSYVGMAADSLELLQGVDCPYTAVYVDNIIMTQGHDAKRIKNCICIFETYGQMSARRHRFSYLYSKKYGKGVHLEYLNAMAEYGLVIRTITTAENYDYIFDYILHLNGVIEVRTSTAGYLITSPYYANDDDFGFKNFYEMKGPLHDHMVAYKVDLDVDGSKNVYKTLDIVKRSEPSAWNKTWNMIKKTMKKNIRRNEMDARLFYDFDQPKYYVFENPNVKNPYGNPVGYRLQLEDMVKQVYPDDYYITKSSQWTKYQLAVTKHKDQEQFSGSIFNVYGTEDPVFEFDHYMKDNESIYNEDLVCWVTVGGLHIPNTEDIPTTFTTGNQFTFFIRPFGFFQEDPTMGSPDAVFVKPSPDRQTCCHVETYETPQESLCPVPKRTFNYGGS